MKKIIFSVLLTAIFLSCMQQDEEEFFQEIRILEFKRCVDPNSFEQYLENENPQIRILAADAIARIGKPVYTSSLQKLLKDKNSQVVSKSIFALGQIGNQDSLLLVLLDDESIIPYQGEIISTLGRTSSQVALKALISRLPDFPDSLKALALTSITKLAPSKYRDRKSIKLFRSYLQHPDQRVRDSAAYFFSRHPHTLAIHPLIRANFTPYSNGDKYRLRALMRSLENYYIQTTDSALFDSLKQRLVKDLQKDTGDWRHKIYQIPILYHLQDQQSFNIVKKYLNDSNPHLRKAAITTLTRFDTLEAKQSLLKAYPSGSWSDKGEIILALSKKYPEMTYSLIQNNLDKGSTHFKQLLLKSLASIKNRMAIRQLQQFLLVPNTRLNLTAFEELSDLRYMGYKSAKGFLLSGDFALTAIAAEWIIEHPEWANYDDISAAYGKFSEPAGVEVMLTLLKVMEKVRSAESVKFLQDIYQTTSSFVVAEQVRKSFASSDIKLQPRIDLDVNLFVPEKIHYQKEPIKAKIETEKGDIDIHLRPDLAPATVANFVYLTEKGFYKNLTFHRVVSDFVIQGGDPRGDGWGGPNYAIPCEYSEVPFKRGTIGMATAGKDTGGSQFFICHSEQPHLNCRYTIFGEVIEGMDVVDNIEIDDKIIQVVIQN